MNDGSDKNLKSGIDSIADGAAGARADESPRSRTELMIGPEGVARLSAASVLVCGLGGVGGYAMEALARAGVGTLGLLDCDVVSVSNLNRQILATHSSIGLKKTEAGRKRIAEINPECRVKTYDIFYSSETADRVALSEYDYVLDAIDTVSSKIALISAAKAAGVPVISCMGAGNKLGTDFKVADVSATKACPLAKTVRKLLRERGISGVKAVYSEEEPITPAEQRLENGRHIPGSMSCAPAAAGITAAGAVLRDLLGR